MKQLGLVCITRSEAVRFRTTTRARYLALPAAARPGFLAELYRHNLERLLGALEFCAHHEIHLYRLSANLFPLSDWEDGVGLAVLAGLAADLAAFGPRADALGIRVVIHPEQFVVLSSVRPEVVANSVAILKHHTFVLDLLALPATTWCAMNIHGGKGGRGDALIDTIRALPERVRSRLTLENDERAYHADDILKVCEAAGVPMIFDAHHHVVAEGLAGFGDPSVAAYTEAARKTWEPPDWQIVHLSNGKTGPRDARHADFITEVPEAFSGVGWVEVEAKAKEEALAHLRLKER